MQKKPKKPKKIAGSSGRPLEINLDEDEVPNDAEAGSSGDDDDEGSELEQSEEEDADEDDEEDADENKEGDEDEEMVEEAEDDLLAASDDEASPEDGDDDALDNLDRFIESLETKKRKADADASSGLPSRKRRQLQERTEFGPEGEFSGAQSGQSIRFPSPSM